MPENDQHDDASEVGRLGRELYARVVKPQLRPEDDNKYVAIDVDTGAFEADESDIEAVMRLHTRRAGAGLVGARGLACGVQNPDAVCGGAIVTGHVNILSEAVLPLRVFGPLGESLVTAVIDTGFTASLTLPAQTIAKLGLVSVSEGEASLADGSHVEYRVHSAEVEWDGVRRRVSVFGIGEDPLDGMAMLRWHRVRIDLAPGGVVEVTRL